MTVLLLVLTVTFPLLLVLGFAWENVRPLMIRVLPVAALPGLALALFGTTETLALPSLVEGAVWGIDDLRRVFLAFTCVIWTVSGIFALCQFRAAERNAHFAVFWLLSLSGNLGLLVARDIGSFYTLFALMTLSSYGLIAHTRSPQALRASRIFIAMALAGEMALLSGLIIAAAPGRLELLGEIPFTVVASEYRTWIIALLFCGFGVKAGIIGLHLWLPLAYPAAPNPASAVLGGAMINAGLFGWIVTLPLGLLALPGWSALLITMGLLSAFGAALPGLCQRDAKAVLAYSSISQMGLITAMVGVALVAPGKSNVIIAALVLYAMHHGLAKCALFLGQGAAAHAGGMPPTLFWLMNALPGLSLAGLLLTSGAAAKGALKDALAQAEVSSEISVWLEPMMSFAAVATFLLMARYLWCLQSQQGTGDNNAGLVISWLLAVLCSLLLFWWLPLPGYLMPSSAALSGNLGTGLAHPWDYLWPPLLGLSLAVVAWRLRLRAPAIPPGDLVVLLDKVSHHGKQQFDALAVKLGQGQTALLDKSRRICKELMTYLTRVLDAEQALRAYAGLGFAMLLVALLAMQLL